MTIIGRRSAELRTTTAPVDADLAHHMTNGGIPEALPTRAPAIQRVLNTWAIAMLKAPDDAKRLQAITTASKLLVRFGGDSFEPREWMTESALYTYNLDADQVQAAMADGVRHAETAGAGQGALDQPGDPGPTVSSEANDPWTEPKEIKPALLPVPPFNPDALLPPVLRNFVMDEAERMPCAPDYIAASLLSVLGSVIGARCFIRPKALDTWSVPPNLWNMNVGEPSSLKTPAMNAAIKPLDRLIADVKASYGADLEAFEHDKMVREATMKALQAELNTAAKNGKPEAEAAARRICEHKKAAPKAPAERRYKTNDTTVEKLGELLKDSPAGVAICRDEIVGLLASWDREGHESDRQFYLEAWNGNSSHDVDRIGRGSIHIPNLCVTILGGIQPDKLRAYQEMTEDRLSNDGVLQRFQLLVYPDPCQWEYRDRPPLAGASDRVFKVIKELADFDPIMWGAESPWLSDPTLAFRFDDDAQSIFIGWLTDLHCKRINPADHSLVRQHLAKYQKLMPALALILHLVECSATDRRGPVTASAAAMAADWCSYLEAHARRCYGLLLDGGATAAKLLADKIMAGKLPDGFTFRNIDKAAWSGLTTKKAIEGAVDWLEDSGWIKGTEQTGGKRGGRPTVRYTIHPRLPRAPQ